MGQSWITTQSTESTTLGEKPQTMTVSAAFLDVPPFCPAHPSLWMGLSRLSFITQQLPNFPSLPAFLSVGSCWGIKLSREEGQSLDPTRGISQGFTCHCPPAHHPVRGATKVKCTARGIPCLLSEPQSSHAAAPNYPSNYRGATVCCIDQNRKLGRGYHCFA